MTTANKAQYRQNLKSFTNALKGKYKVNKTVRQALVIGNAHVKIDGGFYDAATSGLKGGIASVTNIGRPAAALYATSEGGVVMAAGGGMLVSAPGGGGGTGGGVTDNALLNAIRGAAIVTVGNDGSLTNDRSLAVSGALTINDGGPNDSLTIGMATPGTVSASTTSSAIGAHTHAADASSNPGAAVALLKSDATGLLTLPLLTATTKLRTPLIDTASGDLALTPASALVTTTNLTGTGTVQGATVIGTTKLRTPLIDTAAGNLSIVPAGGTAAITGALTVSTTATVTTSVQTPLLTTASNVDLVVNPAGTGAVQFPNDQKLRTSAFDSSFPIGGWQINEVAGVAGKSALTIGEIQADELSVRVFVADEVRVDRGDEYWTKSYGIIAAAFTTPAAIGSAVSVKFEDSPALAGAIFSNNDWLLIRKLEIGTGLSLYSVWGQVNSYIDNADATQNWTFTLRSGPVNKPILKGSLGIDFGASGAALIHLSVIDAAGAPYIKMRRWNGANPYTPANYTTYVQLGNLGSVGNALYTPSGDGIYIRSTASAGQFIVADNNGLQIRGADFKAYNGSLQTVSIASADGSAKLGTDISSPATTSFDFNGTDGKLRIAGDFSAAQDEVQANDYGLNILANSTTPVPGGNYAPGLKFTTNTTVPTRATVVGHLIGERYTAGPVNYNRLTIRTESGAAAGVPDAYLNLSATDGDTAFGTASIDLHVSDTQPNSVSIFSQTSAGASSNIGLYGNTLTYHVRPVTDSAYNLGDGAFYYNHLYVRNLHTDTIVGNPAQSHNHSAADLTTGILSLAVIPTTLTGKDADTLDGNHGAAFSLTSHHHDSQYVGALTQGSGISITGTIAGYTIAHTDTSTVATVTGTGGTVLYGATFDTYGHVTAATTINLDSRYVQPSGLTGYVPTTRLVSAGAALTGGGALSADITLAHADTSVQANVTNTGVNFISGMTFDTYGHVQTVASASVSSALDALYVNVSGDTMTGGLLLPAGSVEAPSLARSDGSNTGLYWPFPFVLGIALSGVASVIFTPAQLITPTAAISAAADLDTDHILGRARVSYAAATDSATFSHYDFSTAGGAALAQYASGAVRLNAPTGQVITLAVNGVETTSVTADRLLPRSSVQIDLGDYNRKLRTIYAAELAVQTLVAQEVISTIGGQILVTPTAKLIADIASSAGSGGGGSDTIYTGLVGWWALDETTGTRSDSKGINHLADKNTVAVATGKAGQAASFVAANSERLWIADNAALSVGDIDFYVSGWIYPTLDDGTTQVIASKYGASGERAWSLTVNWATNKLEFSIYDPTNVLKTVATVGSVTVNAWSFVEGWHGATLNQIGVALNRTEATTAHTTGVKATEAGNFTIGAGNTSLYFNGRIDEFGYWKSLPDTTRRDFLYNAGSGRNFTDITNYGAGAFSLDLDRNGFVVGEFVVMSAAPGGIAQFEAFQLTAAPTIVTGGYRYAAVRNLDGSGQNNWYAGDAVTSLGAAIGSGYIDLTATATIHNHAGPTIAHYVRRGTGAWNAVAPVVVSGNLRSFVDYVADEFGHAAGNDLLLRPETGFKGYTIDTINGMRTFNVDISLYEDAVAFLKIGTVSGFLIETNDTVSSDNRSISFVRGGAGRSYIKGHQLGGVINALRLGVDAVTGLESTGEFVVASPVAQAASLLLAALSGANQSTIEIRQQTVANNAYIALTSTGSITLTADQTQITGNVNFGGGTLDNIGSFGSFNLLSFNTGWGDYGGGYTAGAYKKVGDLVFLRGLVIRTSGSSATIATLPAGYRPAATCVLPIVSADAFGEIRIDTAGLIVLNVGVATTWVSLDGIVFSTL